MKFLNFAILCSFLFVGDSENLNDEFLEFGLTFYQSRSVIFPLYANISLSYYSRVKKLLTSLRKRYFFSLMSFTNFEKSFQIKYQNGKATVVVFDYGDTFIQILNRLSHTEGISRYKWLLTTPKLKSEDFSAVEIPLMNELIVAEKQPLGGYNLTEIYDAKPGIKLYNNLGRWMKGGKNLEISRDFFKRRKNLQGIAIKIVSPSKDPCSERSFAEGIASIVICIHKKIWNVLTEMLNVTTETIIEPNLTVNTLQNTGAELTLRSFPLNPFDAETRSYLWPVFGTKTEIVSSYVEQKVKWETYILPFSKRMWLGILVWVVFSDLVLLFGEVLTRRGTYGDAMVAYWSKYSFASFFAFCDQTVSDAPKFISYRIVFLAMFLAPCVLLSGYSAVVTSYLTVPLRKMPFINLQELSQTESYELGWHRSFPVEYLFNLNDSSSTNQALLKNNVLPKTKLPTTDAEGVERMCTTKFAFLTTMETILALKPKCNYFKLKEYFRIIFTTIEIKKSSWYEYLLNRCERSVDFTGTLHRISLQAVMTYVRDRENVILTTDKAQPILMENIILPFAVLLLGVILSMVILFLEILFFKMSSKNHLIFRQRYARQEWKGSRKRKV